jgi:hypothetical protein
MKYGDETVAFFEIDQPRCALTYGVAPCTAVLGTTGARKCFNTRATCQSTSNYAPSETVTLRFCRPQSDLTRLYGPLIPSLQSFNIAPLAINLGGMDPDASSLGHRETLTVVLDDHLYSDHLLDKYRLERASGVAVQGGVGYDSYSRGTFWGRFLARNPYASSFAARLRTGTAGQALTDMQVRQYVIDHVEGPVEGRVTVVCKDPFTLIDRKKSVAPKASTGRLSANITNVDTSATLTPAGIGNAEYPASGVLRIGQEAMNFTRSGDVLTLTRAQYGTAAAAHSQEDVAQLCLVYTAQRCHDIVYSLLTTYTAVPAASIPKAAWDAAASPLPQLYTGIVAEPTPVADLIGELEAQAGFTVWPDVATNQILFKALVASAPTATVDDAGWLVDKSLSLTRLDDKRASQVWVYYAQVDPTKRQDDPFNYRSRTVSVNLVAEGQQQYGVPAVREMYSRWIPQFGRTVALASGDRLLAMFTDPPIEARFKLHAIKSGKLALGELFNLQAQELQQDDGSAGTRSMIPKQLGVTEDDLVTVDAQEVTFAPGGGGDDPTAERVIYLDSDAQNLNLRSVYETLYTPPTGVETVTFELGSGVVISSSSTSLPAIRTGSWPAGVTLKLRVLAGGKVRGHGGRGAKGGSNVPGSVGEQGGPALQADRALTVDSAGDIWAGGGGGGGGGGGFDNVGLGAPRGGGGGGGGAGDDPGAGEIGGDYFGNTGSNATENAGGLGGGQNLFGGAGGNGGAPGVAGDPGVDGTNNGAGATVGGAGGAAGNYIVGNANVTWLANGDRRGAVA